eukprot:6181354-Pleurochrysis_carterae.AAC.4
MRVHTRVASAPRTSQDRWRQGLPGSHHNRSSRRLDVRVTEFGPCRLDEWFNQADPCPAACSTCEEKGCDRRNRLQRANSCSERSPLALARVRLGVCFMR